MALTTTIQTYARSQGLIRALVWLLLLAAVTVDALVASAISLGLLYFVPLSLGALRLRRWDVAGLVLVCVVGRVLFGPTGDPLSLQALTYRLPSSMEPWANGIITAIGYAAVGALILRMREQGRRLRRLDREVETDPLTLVGNRRALTRTLRENLRRDASVSVLCVDIDHFKTINDTFGHDAGDRVLQQLAARLSDSIRNQDSVARTGGEEFLVVLPGTPEDEAMMVAERIRLAVAGEPMLAAGDAILVTVSVGVATGAPGEALLAEADAGLYRAKRAGRNRVMASAGRSEPGLAAALTAAGTG